MENRDGKIIDIEQDRVYIPLKAVIEAIQRTFTSENDLQPFLDALNRIPKIKLPNPKFPQARNKDQGLPS